MPQVNINKATHRNREIVVTARIGFVELIICYSFCDAQALVDLSRTALCRHFLCISQHNGDPHSRPYFVVAPGGKCLNILSTLSLRFLMFLSELSESVSLAAPLQISCLVFVSKRSTTTVPTLYVSVVVVASPNPPPPKRLQPQPPPSPS